MQLVLQYQKKVREVKEEFNRSFPYLKLEFVTEKNYLSSIQSSNKIAPPNATLGSVAGAMKEGVITIDPEDTINDLQKLFQKKFGLPVLIYRKEKDSWTEVDEADAATLEDQNEIGRADNQFFKLKSYRYTMVL